jgi:hypothetical protein
MEEWIWREINDKAKLQFTNKENWTFKTCKLKLSETKRRVNWKQ